MTGNGLKQGSKCEHTYRSSNMHWCSPDYGMHLKGNPEPHDKTGTSPDAGQCARQ